MIDLRLLKGSWTQSTAMEGIDVILRMDWLTRHNGVISCATKEVSLVNQEGIKMKCQTRGSKVNPMVFNLDARTIREVPVVQ
jgi:hypothetical protein